MSLASDLSANIDLAKFYRPTPVKRERSKVCTKCGKHPPMKSLCYCSSCNNARMRDYRNRKRTGGNVRNYVRGKI